jgi:hypothetical protein
MPVSDLSWLRFWETFETLGFFLVLLGVIFEGVEHWVKFPKRETARKKRLEKKAWFVLVVGLAIEIVGDNMAKRISDSENARLNNEAADARLETIKLKLQIAQTSNNVAKINPLNLPIVFGTATASFFIIGTNAFLERLVVEPNESHFDKQFVRLLFEDSEEDKFPVGMECENFEISDFSLNGKNKIGFIVKLDFKSDNLLAEWRTDEESKKWDNFSARQFEEFKKAIITIPGLKAGFEAQLGTCDVVLNSVIRKSFNVDTKTEEGQIILRPIKDSAP